MGSSGHLAIGAVLGLTLTAGAAGCNVLGTKLTPGLRACVGIPDAICGEIIQSRANERGAVAITAFQITCSVEPCTEAGGKADVVLNWADGRSETFNYTWAGP